MRCFLWSLSARRAWIEITVVGVLATLVTSLSARRAWIEMSIRKRTPAKPFSSLSARRAWIEIVISAMTSQISVSLSARRAWIEIKFCRNSLTERRVALRKESVDRNDTVQIVIVVVHGRSPQGERG